MRLDPETIILGSCTTVFHSFEFVAQFLGCISNVLEPLDQIIRRVQAAEIQIARAVRP